MAVRVSADDVPQLRGPPALGGAHHGVPIRLEQHVAAGVLNLQHRRAALRGLGQEHPSGDRGSVRWGHRDERHRVAVRGLEEHPPEDRESVRGV